ncbi:serine proteinase stubble-like [Penaeus indicus]|uniref:serine proteinase stubble-like n=1 Tax=Penaeus indicus TaxID=29960 RepID=UPI00300D092C
MGTPQTLSIVSVVLAAVLVSVSAKPIVDPGLFVIQGVTSCLNGTGYCMLGNNCSIDVDFLPAGSGHCKGLRDAFTPKIDFICCKYNPFGKATSEPPTTTVSTYTITDVFSLIDEEIMHGQQQEDYSDINPDNVIDIVGVVTDFTGIVGLVTRPWTGTFPTKATSPTTTPMTPSDPPTTPAPVSPATPLSPGQTEATEEEAVTEATPEPTESYNEIPVGMTEGGDAEVQQETTQQGDSTTPPSDLTPAAGATPPTSIAPEVVGASDDSSESDEEVDMNAIIFPDDPILAGRPETEALEAVTESQVADTHDEAHVEGALIQILESSVVGEHPSQVSQTTQAFAASGVSTSPPALGPLGVQQVDITGEIGEETDYDYYANYPDQILLQPVNQNICGFKGAKPYDDQLSSRILGGVVASTVEWCWVAAIMERRQGGNKFVCSGALVESNLVLTTATCLKRLQNRDLSRYIVVFGDSNLREDLPYGVQFHSLAEVVAHPDYFTSGGAHASDIGVIRLRDHATLSDNVCLVCMAQQDAMFPAQTCTVTGYGVGDIPPPMLKDVQNTVPLEGILRQLSVPVHKEADCRDTLRNVTRSEILASSDSFLCAGGTGDGSACYSTMDGGSPLACEAGGRWFLAGLVSWTRDCTVPGTPNVYTRVSSFTNWLQATHLRMMGFATHQIKLT